MATVAEKINPIDVTWRRSGNRLRVTLHDKDRFRVQRDFAMDALRVARAREQRFARQLSLLLSRLAAWVEANPDKMKAAFLTLQDNRMSFIAVKSVPAYDPEFEDSLSEMDFEIANDPSFSLVKLNTLAVPPVSEEALLSFLDRRFVLSYHGNGA